MLKYPVGPSIFKTQAALTIYERCKNLRNFCKVTKDKITHLTVNVIHKIKTLQKLCLAYVKLVFWMKKNLNKIQ